MLSIPPNTEQNALMLLSWVCYCSFFGRINNIIISVRDLLTFMKPHKVERRQWTVWNRTDFKMFLSQDLLTPSLPVIYPEPRVWFSNFMFLRVYLCYCYLEIGFKLYIWIHLICCCKVTNFSLFVSVGRFQRLPP